MAMAGFEPAVPTSERPQTHAIDRAATGICIRKFSLLAVGVLRNT